MPKNQNNNNNNNSPLSSSSRGHPSLPFACDVILPSSSERLFSLAHGAPKRDSGGSELRPLSFPSPLPSVAYSQRVKHVVSEDDVEASGAIASSTSSMTRGMQRVNLLSPSPAPSPRISPASSTSTVDGGCPSSSSLNPPDVSNHRHSLPQPSLLPDWTLAKRVILLRKTASALHLVVTKLPDFSFA